MRFFMFGCVNNRSFRGSFVCFVTPFSHRFYSSYPNLMTVARIPTLNYGFFSKKRDRLVLTSKTPDKEYPVRSFGSDDRATGMQ